MNKKTLRKPKGPAIIFLITAISAIITVFNGFIFTEILDTDVALPFMGIIRMFVMASAYIFLSIVLLSKKYDNLLIFAISTLLIPSIIGLFINVTAYLICDMIFFLLLITFTYIAINKQESALREKVVKFRFIIPLLQFALILYSVIQSLQSSYESALERVSTYPEGTVSIVFLLLPVVISSFFSFLPVLSYSWLVNWISDPYDKTKLTD